MHRIDFASQCMPQAHHRSLKPYFISKDSWRKVKTLLKCVCMCVRVLAGLEAGTMTQSQTSITKEMNAQKEVKKKRFKHLRKK